VNKQDIFNVKGTGGAKSLLNALSKSPFYIERALSVSIEKGSVSFVYASARLSKLSVKASGVYRISEGSYPSPDEAASKAELFKNEHKTGKTPVVICVPKAWVAVKTHEYPLSVTENLPQVISYELDSLTPFRADDAYFDFVRLGSDGQTIKVYVAASKKDLIDGYIEAFREKGMEVQRVTFELSSNETLKRYAGGPSALKDIGDASTSALGAAIEVLRPGEGGIDLLGSGIHKRERMPFVLTALVLSALLIMALYYLFTPVQIEGRRLDEIKRQVSSLKEKVGEADAMRKESSAVSNELSFIEGFKGGGKYMAVSMIKELTDLLPRNTWLTKLRIAGTNVYLDGYTQSATELLKRVESSSFFKKAEFASPTSRDTRMNADRFSIKAELEEEPDEKK
jgi:general secretion pathway protein L